MLSCIVSDILFCRSGIQTDVVSFHSGATFAVADARQLYALVFSAGFLKRTHATSLHSMVCISEQRCTMYKVNVIFNETEGYG